MAEIKIEQAEAQAGIKLFGKTIVMDRTANSDVKSTINASSSGDESSQEMKRPDKIIACPRCKSMDTKFCYFNNYNVNQPRHFCKGCQRYWTAGGALRNVPVGAGRRRAKPGPPRPSQDMSSLFDAGVAGVHLEQCVVDGAVFQGYWAQVNVNDLLETGRAGFQPGFPAKRRRINMNDPPGGQTNC